MSWGHEKWVPGGRRITSGGLVVEKNFYIFFTISDINVKGGSGLRAPRIVSRRSPPTHWGAVLWTLRRSLFARRRAYVRRHHADLLQRQVFMSHTFQVLLERSCKGEHEGSDPQRGVFPAPEKEWY